MGIAWQMPYPLAFKKVSDIITDIKPKNPCNTHVLSVTVWGLAVTSDIIYMAWDKPYRMLILPWPGLSL